MCDHTRMLTPRFVLAALLALSPAAARADVDLPDLEEGDESDIVAENIRALGALYFAAQLEDLKFFGVVDELVGLFNQGSLPIGDAGGEAAGAFGSLKRAGARLTTAERQALYVQVTGDDFDRLWRRFLADVAALKRVRPKGPPPPPPVVAVRRSVAALARHLSRHGAGKARAARALESQVQAMQALLGNRAVQSAVGAREPWQVVERVAAQHLGGAPDVARLRARAEAGRAIIDWLAAHPELWSGRGRVTAEQVVRAAEPALFDQVERWQGASGR